MHGPALSEHLGASESPSGVGGTGKAHPSDMFLMPHCCHQRTAKALCAQRCLQLHLTIYMAGNEECLRGLAYIVTMAEHHLNATR